MRTISSSLIFNLGKMRCTRDVLLHHLQTFALFSNIIFLIIRREENNNEMIIKIIANEI